MEQHRDPVTGSPISEVEHRQDQTRWAELSQNLIARLSGQAPQDLCRQIYTFLDAQSQGLRGHRPRIPLCDHAPESYTTDHALLTSAVVYCLAHDNPEIHWMRLAALSHEFPEPAKRALLAILPDATRSALVNAAWMTLQVQETELAQVMDATDSLASFADRRPAASNPLVDLLWYAHLAASARLHNATFIGADGAPVRTIAAQGDWERHPLHRSEYTVGLVYGGATKVKQYVFESVRLPEIRGASALLDRINLVDLPALWGWLPTPPTAAECFGVADLAHAQMVCEEQTDRCRAVRADFAAHHRGSILEAPECIIYAGGGNLLALAPTALVAALASEIEYIYTDQTLVANSAAVSKPFSLLALQYGLQPSRFWLEQYQAAAQNPKTEALLSAYYSYPEALQPGDAAGHFYARKTFGELVTALAADFHRRRAGQADRAIPHFELPPFAIKCYSCGNRPAVVAVQDPGDVAPGQSPKIFCAACARKRITGQVAKDESAQTDWFYDRFTWRPLGVGAWETEFRRHMLEQLRAPEAREDAAAAIRAYFGDLPDALRRQLEKVNRTEEDRDPKASLARRAGIQTLDGRQRARLAAQLGVEERSEEQLIGLVAALETLQRDGPDLLRAAADLGEIGAASDPNDYVGLIYADGNNVGAHVAAITTPAAYRQFAARLYRANEAAVFTALAKHLRPHFLAESADEDRPSRRQFWLDPFEIITIGGDDVMLFVPGKQALDVALTMSQTLEDLLGCRLAPDEPRLPLYAFQRFQPDAGQPTESQPRTLPYRTTISSSAGVVVAKSATPVFYLVEQVEQLQKSAKGMRKQGLAAAPAADPQRSPRHLEDQLAEDQRNLAWRQCWRGGTVDFLVLKSMDVMTSNVHDFRERALRRETREDDELRERLSLTGRPYTWLELEGLLRLARRVRAVDFPRSQQHALHRSLFLGRLPAQVNYLYFFSRLTRAEFREALAEDFHRNWATFDQGTPTPPWRRTTAPAGGNQAELAADDEPKPDVWETVWHDLLEISDFVTAFDDAPKEEADATVSG